MTIPHILKRLSDVDPNVRMMAVKKCADLGPKCFKIFERQNILKSILSEDHKRVKNVGKNYLLVKWYNEYQNSLIDFLNAIKLDADEYDNILTEKISKDVIKLMFRYFSVISYVCIENNVYIFLPIQSGIN